MATRRRDERERERRVGPPDAAPSGPFPTHGESLERAHQRRPRARPPSSSSINAHDAKFPRERTRGKVKMLLLFFFRCIYRPSCTGKWLLGHRCVALGAAYYRRSGASRGNCAHRGSWRVTYGAHHWCATGSGLCKSHCGHIIRPDVTKELLLLLLLHCWCDVHQLLFLYKKWRICHRDDIFFK